jgi:hypothetical protein
MKDRINVFVLKVEVTFENQEESNVSEILLENYQFLILFFSYFLLSLFTSLSDSY